MASPLPRAGAALYTCSIPLLLLSLLPVIVFLFLHHGSSIGLSRIIVRAHTTTPQPTHSNVSFDAYSLDGAPSRHLDLAAERLAFFEACLHRSIAPSSRPLHPLVVLPSSEWRAHTRELFERTAPARRLPLHSYSGYAGPWLENAFIKAVLQGADSEDVLPAFIKDFFSFLQGADSVDLVPALENIFYPAVPLLAQWTDNAVVGNTLASPPSDITTMLRNVFLHQLRPDVLYVAVTQHDHGEPGLNLTCATYANVLLLSAGGWGNVALPLIKGQVPHKSTLPGGKIEDPRSAFFTFVGSEWMGRDAALNLFRTSAHLPLGERFFSSLYTPQWREAASRTVFALAPRGYGRTSFRLYETLQYGTVPVFLYEEDGGQGHPWAPYQDFGAPLSAATKGGMWGPGGVGFVVSYTEIPAFLCIACDFVAAGSAGRWRNLSMLPLSLYGTGPGQTCPCGSAEWEAAVPPLNAKLAGGLVLPQDSLAAEMERRAAALAPAFFTYAAVVQHIKTFLSSPWNSSLTCTPRPKTLGVKGWAWQTC